ncbi:MAG: c-type cytochrome [Planctomycetota bacterium]
MFWTTLALALALAAPFAAPSHGDAPSPARGLKLLYGKAYQGFGVTIDEFDRLWTVWPKDLRRAAEAADDAGRRALALERYGLPLDPERGSATPVAFAESAPGEWTLSCLACHGGDVRGQYVPGLGNSRFAFQTLVRDVLWLRRKDKRAFSEQDEGMALATLNASDGTTNAQVFSAVFLAFRDRNLERQQPPDEELLQSLVEHDLDAPPLWNVRYKSRLYCDGYVGKDARVMMQFALALENDGATVRGFEGDFAHVQAWIESLEAPRWPGTVKDSLVARGEEVFLESCARCHGTYGPDATYPEKRVAREDIGTDSVRLDGLPRGFKERLKGSWLARFGKVPVDVDADGYVAPPLHGIWASAPYFHNGSVPTLWHVLHPSSRPVAWRRDPTGYDAQRVGLLVEERDAPPALERADERRRWFDTRYRGKGAQGHDYPAQLDEAQRRALLEYLKTL